MTRQRCILAVMAIAVVFVVVWFLPRLEDHVGWAWRRAAGAYTVAERLDQFGPTARQRLKPRFAEVGIAYPPAGLVLVGIKDRKLLEVWAQPDDGRFQHIHTYPILAASGGPGPKLREGDRQVPEGQYRIESLHPNSRYHLALRVNYPNANDRQRAEEEQRDNLGGDIMIHGSQASIGCLAMGDPAAEDLFVLVADTGLEKTSLILAPTDFRDPGMTVDATTLPDWVFRRYDRIREAMRDLKR